MTFSQINISLSLTKILFEYFVLTPTLLLPPHTMIFFLTSSAAAPILLTSSPISPVTSCGQVARVRTTSMESVCL